MTKLKIIFILLIIIAISLIGFFTLKQADYSDIALECDKKIAKILTRNNINPKQPFSQNQKNLSGFRKKAVGWEKEFNVPSSTSLDIIKKSFIHDINFSPAKIALIKKTKTAKENIITLELEYKQLKLYRLVLRQKQIKAKIAIVLDDWGYSESVLNPAIKLNTPITYAILPNLPHSQKIAQAFDNNGDEIILHLPLEPHNAAKHALEKNTIFTTMSKQEITNITLNNINSLPNLRGMNNHMGSKATEDENVMGIIFDIIKAKNLYFLDSYTTKQSAITKTADKKNIPLYKRDVFLDDANDKESIKQQLLKAKDIAQQTGMVIAIGHARPLTIETLAEMIPLLEKQGYQFVYLSQLNTKKEYE